MRRLKTTLFALVSLSVGLPAPLHAAPPARDHDITIDDYFSIAVIGNCATSPDGRYVAYVEGRWEPAAEARNNDLWVVDTSTKRERRLTFDAAGESSPRWSPDSRMIYYVANYKRGGETKPPTDGKMQVWRISPEGGEPQAVTRLADGVGWFQLSKDGNTLYYAVTHEVVADDFKSLRGKFKDIEYGHGVDNFTQLWKLDLEGWRAEKLIDENRVIRDADVSPDGRRIAMLTTPTEPLISNEGRSRVDAWDAATKKVTTLPDKLWRADAPSPYGWLDGLAWSADSAALAFTVAFDGYPSELFVAEWNGNAPSIRKLKRPDGVYVKNPLRWRGASRDLCFVGDHRAVTHVYSIADVRDGKQSETARITVDDAVVTGFSFNASGDRFAVVASTVTSPPEIYWVLQRGENNDKHGKGSLEFQTQLTRANPQVETWKLPQLSKVTWKGAGKDEVEGILELPPGYKPGDGKLPMIVELHGGPTDATPFCLIYWIYGRTLLPAKGYAVFSPNYRGSTGYGDRFLTDLIGHENDIEVEDILTGVDAMIAKGIADPDKLGVMGWSNGGFLTNCVISKTTRFKAASSGAGVVDQFLQWGLEDTPGHVNNYMQGYPWQHPAAYDKASPSAFLNKIKTPTLIHVGGNDSRVPPGHARALYRALHEYLHVPTELLVYPGEGHGLTKYKNRKAKMEWDLAWFDRYVRGRSSDAAGKPASD